MTTTKPSTNSLDRVGFLHASPDKPVGDNLQRIYTLQDKALDLIARKFEIAGDKLTGLELAALAQTLVKLGKALEDRE